MACRAHRGAADRETQTTGVSAAPRLEALTPPPAPSRDGPAWGRSPYAREEGGGWGPRPGLKSSLPPDRRPWSDGFTNRGDDTAPRPGMAAPPASSDWLVAVGPSLQPRGQRLLLCRGDRSTYVPRMVSRLPRRRHPHRVLSIGSPSGRTAVERAAHRPDDLSWLDWLSPSPDSSPIAACRPNRHARPSSTPRCLPLSRSCWLRCCCGFAERMSTASPATFSTSR